tara:strand:+ start:1179 stop:1289 length:111 start_codon:yes stop_codon:yes gene_type:complete
MLALAISAAGIKVILFLRYLKFVFLWELRNGPSHEK